MGFLESLYKWKFTSEERLDSQARKFELRIVMLLSSLFAMVDYAFDISVIHNWITAADGVSMTCIVLGLSSVILSDLIDTVFYVCNNRSRATCVGIVAHLFGFGCAYQCFYSWWYPKDMFIEDIYLLWGVSDFFLCRLVECLVEALPMAAIQCFVMVQQQRFSLFLLISICTSFLCTSLPALTFIEAVQHDESGAIRRALSWILNAWVWTTDTLVRTVPLMYLLVHRFEEGIVLIAFIMVMSTVYVTFLFDMRCAYGEHGYVLGWTLTFNSVYKIFSFLYRDAVKKMKYTVMESIIRTSMSVGIALYLYLNGLVHSWQFGSFIVMALFTCAMQCKFYLQLKISARARGALAREILRASELVEVELVEVVTSSGEDSLVVFQHIKEEAEDENEFSGYESLEEIRIEKASTTSTGKLSSESKLNVAEVKKLDIFLHEVSSEPSTGYDNKENAEE